MALFETTASALASALGSFLLSEALMSTYTNLESASDSFCCLKPRARLTRQARANVKTLCHNQPIGVVVATEEETNTAEINLHSSH